MHIIAKILSNMKETFAINDFVSVHTESKTTLDLVERFKKRRKELGITQKSLSIRFGVSYASIRRFETKGEISLFSFIKLAIDCLNDFECLFKNQKIRSLKELYENTKY